MDSKDRIGGAVFDLACELAEDYAGLAPAMIEASPRREG